MTSLSRCFYSELTFWNVSGTTCRIAGYNLDHPKFEGADWYSTFVLFVGFGRWWGLKIGGKVHVLWYEMCLFQPPKTRLRQMWRTWGFGDLHHLREGKLALSWFVDGSEIRLTSWYIVYPIIDIIYRVLHIPGGAECLPPTVLLTEYHFNFTLSLFFNQPFLCAFSLVFLLSGIYAGAFPLPLRQCKPLFLIEQGDFWRWKNLSVFSLSALDLVLYNL